MKERIIILPRPRRILGLTRKTIRAERQLCPADNGGNARMRPFISRTVVTR